MTIIYKPGILYDAMEHRNIRKEMERARLLACYNWLLKGMQRAKVLTVLESAMITSRIRHVIKKRFSNNGITQRSVGRIIKALERMGLVKEVAQHEVEGLGRMYETTKLGKKMQELLRQTGLG